MIRKLFLKKKNLIPWLGGNFLFFFSQWKWQINDPILRATFRALNPLFIGLHACLLLQLFPICPVFQVKFFLQLSLAPWCEELTHWKRPWCWEGLRAGGEGDDRGWDGWMASPTQWTWVWVDSGTDGQGGLACCGSWGCRVRHNWAT